MVAYGLRDPGLPLSAGLAVLVGVFGRNQSLRSLAKVVSVVVFRNGKFDRQSGLPGGIASQRAAERAPR